jgi:hypothetical protein
VGVLPRVPFLPGFACLWYDIFEPFKSATSTTLLAVGTLCHRDAELARIGARLVRWRIQCSGLHSGIVCFEGRITGPFGPSALITAAVLAAANSLDNDVSVLHVQILGKSDLKTAMTLELRNLEDYERMNNALITPPPI